MRQVPRPQAGRLFTASGLTPPIGSAACWVPNVNDSSVAGLWPVLAVVGGSGGVGASTFAAFLALVAGRHLGGRSVLVDLAPMSGGIDVLLGSEAVPGPRWSALRLAGGRLDPQALADGLPAWRSVSVLAADVVDLPPPVALTQLLDVARRVGPVVLDLARDPSTTRAAALERCDLAVVVAMGDVSAVTAARTVVGTLGPGAAGPYGAGLAVRVGRTADSIRLAGLIGLPLVGVVPAMRCAEGLPQRVPRRMGQLVRGVLDGIQR